MSRQSPYSSIRLLVALFFLCLALSPSQHTAEPALDTVASTARSYLIQGSDLETVARVVRQAGGEITHELSVVRAVAARLSDDQRAALSRQPQLRLYENAAVEVARRTSDTFHRYTEFPKRVKAHRLHKNQISGYGSSLAVIDTGYFPHPHMLWNSWYQNRVIAHYDAIEDVYLSPYDFSDDSGHGSHVTSISVNSSRDGNRYNGMAPDADLVVVKAFDANGRATYADVIRGLDWVIANKELCNIRVLNLSFSAEPRSHYWDDPLNQAVMAAWQAGIVVVAAAGNGGPDPMTVGVPGNVPYVITVGAMTDAYTPKDDSDDYLASFSATGPTTEGFVKPEIVAPGGHIESLMPWWSQIAIEFPEFHDGGSYFVMSGTSQAAAVVSGAAMLLLENEPWLEPDDVKCRLIASARPAVDANGDLAYSPLQQGAGILNVNKASRISDVGCANGGLNIDLDVAGLEHYAGPVRLSDDGSTFYIEGTGHDWTGGWTLNGYLWTGGNPWIDTSLWSSGNPWIDASAWSSGNPWIDASGNPWIDTSGNPWIDASWWNGQNAPSLGMRSMMSINQWVDQQ